MWQHLALFFLLRTHVSIGWFSAGAREKVQNTHGSEMDNKRRKKEFTQLNAFAISSMESEE